MGRTCSILQTIPRFIWLLLVLITNVYLLSLMTNDSHPELMAKLVHEHNKINKGPPKKRKIPHTMYSDSDSGIPIGFTALPKSKRILKQLSAMSTSSSDESELGDGSGTPSSTATSSSNTKIEIDQDGGISTNKSNHQEEAAMLVALRNVIKKKEEKTSTIHDEEPAKDTSSITTGVERPSFSGAGCDAGVAKTAHDAIQLMREDLIDFNWTEVRASSGATTTTKERDVKATAAEDTSSTRTNSASASVTSKTAQDAIKLPSNWAERLLEEKIGIA